MTDDIAMRWLVDRSVVARHGFRRREHDVVVTFDIWRFAYSAVVERSATVMALSTLGGAERATAGTAMVGRRRTDWSRRLESERFLTAGARRASEDQMMASDFRCHTSTGCAALPVELLESIGSGRASSVQFTIDGGDLVACRTTDSANLAVWHILRWHDNEIAEMWSIRETSDHSKPITTPEWSPT